MAVYQYLNKNQTIKKELIGVLDAIIEENFPEIKKEIVIRVESYKGPNFGHYSSSISREVTKKTGISVVKVAETFVSEIYNSEISTKIDKVENINGFLNFYFKTEYLIDYLKEIYESRLLGKGNSLKGSKVVIEHTNANPFKEPHIGHLMNNVIGESLSRILKSQSAEVYSICYQGDVGIHVSKCIYGILSQIEKNIYSLDEFLLSKEENIIEYINEAYMLGSQSFLNDKEKIEIQVLNLLLYKISQEIPKSLGINIVNKYEFTSKFMNKYEEISKIYKRGREVSIKNLQQIFSEYGSTFDRGYFESVSAEVGTKIVRASELFEKSDGALIWRGQQPEFHTQVLLNSYGIPTYATKDIGFVSQKIDDYNPDTLITLTGEEQRFYFKDLFEIFRLLGHKRKFIHIAHGELKFAGGKKMSSRTGDIVSAKELLEEIETEIEIKFSSIEGQSKLESKSKTLAISAIKFQILRNNPGSSIQYDREKSIEVTGSTGPYLLYTYARGKRLLSKAGVFELEEYPNEISVDEKELLLNCIIFNETLEEASSNLNPAIASNYLISLAKSFNKFYNNYQILGIPEKNTYHFRLFLTTVVCEIIGMGCELLGFETLEEI